MWSHPVPSRVPQLAWLLAIFVLGAGTGCARDEAPPAPRLERLALSPQALTLAVDEQQTIRVDGVFDDGSRVDLTAAVRFDIEGAEAGVVEVLNAGVLDATEEGGRAIRALRPGGALLVVAGEGLSAQLPIAVRAQRPEGALVVDEQNPRYFRARNGEIVYLTGSHTWTGAQDDGQVDPPPVFDYAGFLDFVASHGHDLVRLWAWEQAAWATDVEGDYFIAPLPYARTGPGTARDGKPRFDVDRLDDAYFERLRERLEQSRERGLYVVIMLFNGWSVAPVGLSLENPWLGHPFHADNNVNGLDGDPDGDGAGDEVHTLAVPGITAAQEAYVRRVVETASPFDNVLYEISNESRVDSFEWQEHMIGVIREHERALGTPHPVGMTVQWPGGSNDPLFASSADWISPRRTYDDAPLEPMESDGRKVILYDTDHICGTCGEVEWVWKSVTRGLQPLFMDSYDNHAVGLGAGTDATSEALREAIRRNLGWARVYAERMDLRRARPRPGIASTPYTLAELDGPRPRILAFVEGRDVEIALPNPGAVFDVEWFRPQLGEALDGGTVEGGGRRALQAPVDGPIVLFLEARDRGGKP